MTKAEAVAFLEGLVAQPVNMITLDPVKWAEVKALAVAALTNPTVDPKFKKAVEDVNAVVDAALG